MSIITRQEQINNRWLTWVAYNGLNCFLFETDNQLTEAEAEQKLLDWQASQIVIPEVTNGTTN